MNAVQFESNVVSLLHASPDDVLIALASQGNRNALGVLYARHAEALRVTASAALRDTGAAADDVVNDVFVRLLENRSAPFAPAPGRALAWLRGIVRRTADAYRAGRSP